MVYFSDNETEVIANKSANYQANKPKSKFCIKSNPQTQPEFNNMDEDLGLVDNDENVPIVSRSKSTYDKKRPTFLQNKKLNPIKCDTGYDSKSSELKKYLSPSNISKKAEESGLSTGTGEIKSPECSSSRLTVKFSKEDHNNEEIKDNKESTGSQNSMIKLKSEIKFYNYLMLWISIISETCQRLTDELKMPNSFFTFLKNYFYRFD